MKKQRQCRCIQAADKALEPRNARLAKAYSLSSGVVFPVFALEKVDSKAKGDRPTLVPSFCPFCGKQYPRTGVEMKPVRKRATRCASGEVSK